MNFYALLNKSTIFKIILLRGHYFTNCIVVYVPEGTHITNVQLNKLQKS